MRAMLIFVAVLFLSGALPAQQRRPPAPVPRTFVPDEPLPCAAFNRMAARLDAVYRVEDISKAEYEQGMKKYRDGTQVEGVDYFMPEKDKYQRTILQLDQRTEFIRWYAAEGGRSQMATANTQCNIELGEREGTYAHIDAIRQLEDTLTVTQAEGMLADAAMEGQDVVIKAYLQSEAERRKVVEGYNALVENLNTYNKAVNELVGTMNAAMDPKGSKLAPMLSFNFVRLQPMACTGSTLTFSNSTAYLANLSKLANATTTIHCE
ncbi:MAG TPA: hypothetical protein VE263_13635 [Candidatus Angelobacter sp.]|nr:hypothetical protein [Candidatus Angelobacter sp.]